MAFLAPAGTAIAGAISSIGGASTLSAIGTGIGIVGSLAQANYQSKIAKRQAELDEYQAEQTRQRGQVEQQERDMEAARLMSDQRARQSATGFEVGSTSFNRTNRMQSILARRDALRVRDSAEREALSLENSAASSRAEAKGARRAGMFSVIEGGLGLGSDMISSAALSNRRKAAKITREARGVS